MLDHANTWRRRVRKFEIESHKLFAKFETSASRVVELKKLVRGLSGLPIDVEGYFREAAACLESGSYRAAIVMSWAGFFSVFMDKMYIAKEADIRNQYPRWRFGSVEELKEAQTENALLQAARILRFIGNPTFRIYDGQLSTRNLCAHPTLYSPRQNEAIGYVDLMISQTRTYL